MKTKTRTKAPVRPKLKKNTFRVVKHRPLSTVQRTRPTTALQRQQPIAKAVTAELVGRSLTDEIALGSLGLVELKLTDAEEAVLAEPVPLADMLIKPTGQPYLSHPSYTRWFNRAFGRTGWQLVPVSKPMKSGSGKRVTVVVPYVLHVHKQPIAFAQGEQDYYEDNAEQTFGDALESTVASALRRCAKRLGVGLELWDKAWLEGWKRQHAVMVQIEVKARGAAESEKKWVWRLKTAEPFYNEVGRGQRRQTETRTPPPKQEPPAGENTKGEEPITRGTAEKPGQVQRLWSIIKRSGRKDTEIRMWLKERFGLDSTDAIKRKDYDFICTSIEHPGPLPLKAEEPRW